MAKPTSIHVNQTDKLKLTKIQEELGLTSITETIRVLMIIYNHTKK